ncbi:hypothetical protein [Flavivirga algicola]|uniref:Uncharacterized protein n=1 Tax=Flavivirga algicola TaxID=2729136 RepID=A0ABX1S4B0_9FLAO|nr:hypothetical protein [Flavivirga algicola]NMH89893.1 hypothetical protein [Flavivirga algicola]
METILYAIIIAISGNFTTDIEVSKEETKYKMTATAASKKKGGKFNGSGASGSW